MIKSRVSSVGLIVKAVGSQFQLVKSKLGPSCDAVSGIHREYRH